MRLVIGKDIQNSGQEQDNQCEKQKYYVRPAIKTTRPSHFNDIHLNKLEDVFSKRQKPDEIQLRILAMECSLQYMDVKVSF